MISIRPGSASDRSAVILLLQNSALPIKDVNESLEHYLVAEDDHNIIGCIGLDVFKNTGLLRSMAVHPEFRNQGIGRRLATELIQLANRVGITELYLLTTDASAYFQQLGFREIGREATPDPIRQTEQFRSLCPSSAHCMWKPL
jgi:amino-acid N-acetyltransferase